MEKLFFAEIWKAKINQIKIYIHSFSTILNNLHILLRPSNWYGRRLCEIENKTSYLPCILPQINSHRVRIVPRHINPAWTKFSLYSFSQKFLTQIIDNNDYDVWRILVIHFYCVYQLCNNYNMKEEIHLVHSFLIRNGKNLFHLKICRNYLNLP